MATIRQSLFDKIVWVGNRVPAPEYASNVSGIVSNGTEVSKQVEARSARSWNKQTFEKERENPWSSGAYDCQCLGALKIAYPTIRSIRLTHSYERSAVLCSPKYFSFYNPGNKTRRRVAIATNRHINFIDISRHIKSNWKPRKDTSDFNTNKPARTENIDSLFCTRKFAYSISNRLVIHCTVLQYQWHLSTPTIVSNALHYRCDCWLAVRTRVVTLISYYRKIETEVLFTRIYIMLWFILLKELPKWNEMAKALCNTWICSAH